MKKYLLIIFVAALLFFVPAMGYTEQVEFIDTSITSQVVDGSSSANNQLYLYFPNIENYKTAVYYEFIPDKSSNMYFRTAGGADDYISMYSECEYYDGASKIGSGYIQIIYYSGTGYEGIKYFFTSWNIGARTGAKDIGVKLINFPAGSGFYPAGNIKYLTTASLTPTNPCIRLTSYGWVSGQSYFAYTTTYKATVDYSEQELSTTHVNVNRYVDGVNYPSTVQSYVGTRYYVNDYAISGNVSFLIDTYPSVLKIKFGYPVPIKTNTWTINGTNYELDITEGDVEGPTSTPTPTQPPLTQTVTATPTIRPDTCGFWTATLDTNQIHRGGNVTVTLAETDPDDDFDMIEYFTVLPNGQKRVQVRYVNDPGLFGFGAGWVKTYPDTTLPPEASSVAAAKTFTQVMDFSGTNQIGVSIFDDKSLVRTLYSDYQAVCGFLLDVIVGGPQTPEDPTTQRIGINVWEAESKAIVTNALICTQDQSTGIWMNQSNGYGGTTYFEAVPGRSLRIYIEKSPWLTYNQIITVPNPPGTHGVYLYRPIEQVANKSAVIFTVRAAGTYPFALSGASINFANETKTTNSGGVAGFYGLDEAESYYYTIARYGYFATSGYITVPADDLYTTVYMQLDASIVQPTPTQDNFGPDAGFGGGGVGGDATPTPTPGTGGDGGWFFPGFGGSGTGTGTGGTPATPATPLPTLNTTVRQERIGQAMNLWGENLPALSQFFILLIMIGGLGMIMDTLDRRKRRR